MTPSRTLALAVAAVAVVGTAVSARAEIIFGLTTQNGISVIDSAAPTVSIDGGVVQGIAPGENLVAIDYRPANGQVYAVGNFNNLYTIDQSTFNASLVGSFSPKLKGTSFAFDFNPAFMNGQFARIISDTDNNRVISGDTGQYLAPVEKTPVFYPAGDPSAGTDPNVVGIAYNNNVAGATTTQQFGIDRNTGNLVTVANNAGTLNTIGSLGVVPITNETDIDISGATGIAYAVIQPGPNSQLYTVNLTTGAATSLGVFGSGDVIRDLTVIPAAIPEPTALAAVGLVGLGLARRRR